jgi:hypothetical protein
MTGLVRKATLLSACGLLAAATAMAGVPDPANSSKPVRVSVLGTQTGNADPNAAFPVVVRDLANNPIPSSSVVIDLVNCTDTRISNQTANIAGQTVDCALKTVRALTDATGSVTMSVLGAAMNPSGASAPGPGAGCVRIFADGVLLGTATALVFDQNGGSIPGSDGVEISDLSRWLVDFGSFGAGGPYVGRSDYNHIASPGNIGIDDLSAWLVRFGAGTSASGTFSLGFCP